MVEDNKNIKPLTENEEYFKFVADNTPMGIFIQTNKRFAYLNKAALKAFGAKREGELLGQLVLDRFHPDFRSVVGERIQALNEKLEAAPSLDEKYLRMDGTAFDVEVSAIPFNYHGQNGALVFFKDTSERIKREKEVDQYLEKIMRLNDLMTGRGVRMIELKKEIRTLKDKDDRKK